MRKRFSREQNTESAEAQNLCIWMTAGVISFKLCPFNYDCEHCDLDKAMQSKVKLRKISSKAKRDRSKTSVTSERSVKKPLAFFTFSVGEVDKELYLHPAHLWTRWVENQKWKFGIGKLLAYLLPPPLSVELRDQNTRVVQNQSIGKLKIRSGIVPLIAPLSGFLVRVNPRISKRPELVQQDPYGEGWLAEINWFQEHSELEGLYTGSEVRRFLIEEAQHLDSFLRHRGIKINNIGETLPDGGANIKYLHQVLPDQVCLGLVGELILTGRQAW